MTRNTLENHTVYFADSENELIGWQGDSFDPQEVFAKATEYVHTSVAYSVAPEKLPWHV